jgi:hypothetical protein
MMNIYFHVLVLMMMFYSHDESGQKTKDRK